MAKAKEVGVEVVGDPTLYLNPKPYDPKPYTETQNPKPKPKALSFSCACFAAMLLPYSSFLGPGGDKGHSPCFSLLKLRV